MIIRTLGGGGGFPVGYMSENGKIQFCNSKMRFSSKIESFPWKMHFSICLKIFLNHGGMYSLEGKIQQIFQKTKS